MQDQPVAEPDRPITHLAKEAYTQVLAKAGASLMRDTADKRVIQGVRDRTHRRSDSQQEVGGWPTLKSKPTPPDTDSDGMPDDWEKEHQLDPNNPEDRNADQDGYTNLEDYLNSLAAATL